MFSLANHVNYTLTRPGTDRDFSGASRCHRRVRQAHGPLPPGALQRRHLQTEPGKRGTYLIKAEYQSYIL